MEAILLLRAVLEPRRLNQRCLKRSVTIYTNVIVSDRQ